MLAHARPTLRRASALALIAMSGLVGLGCYASHERMDGPVPLPPPDPVPDGSVGVVDAAISESCTRSDAIVSVRVEPITAIHPERCTYGAFAGAMLQEARPEAGGVRLSIDLCPFADDDCRCAVVVSGVGEDLASRLRTRRMVSGETAPDAIRLEDGETLCATCETCFCPSDTIFYAADGLPGSPPLAPASVTFEVGGESCRTDPEPDACWSQRWRVAMIENVGPLAVVPERVEADETEEVLLTRSNTWLRVRRSNGVVCADRHRTEPSKSAWVAWVDDFETRPATR